MLLPKQLVAIAFLSIGWLSGNLETIDGASISFKNQCSHEIEVYDNHTICKLKKGSKQNPQYGCERDIKSGVPTMYRNGKDPDATLAEFMVTTNAAWYDISCVPPGSGDCSSRKECEDKTDKTGFNTALGIYPDKESQKNKNHRCKEIECKNKDCRDAFHYPADNDKVYNCPSDTHFEATFCPK